ncbi:FAD-linked oxidase C-terminal domain-containing protein [Methylopila sp. Yamaguchi]|uniref:FAD-linked oxidase C-terminal domain-containing protein n=1 Tax=Methylopila sp. Yamaguchi TaxID=1437817 RepID=UPI000CB4DAC9|nr:FAD-linked oxidase C-terminal domain-containing protein [Methylopila sp. Yamaguchi]GBD49534.1 D-lactate dehydrogenase (cytochrome) [Methylopila sp. Yamaguchi]
MSGIALLAPDPAILARRDAIVAGLRAIVPGEGVIVSEDERRAFESDALTAYRRVPMVVVLPSTTKQVAEVLAFCSREGVPVIPRGAGTSLAGGALPQEDAVVLGVAKMSKVLDVDLANRTVRVQTGVTNLGVSAAIAHEGFFYAPDPSSQLACTIAGNVAMNSGGAHCLKYGVTTNNLLGVTFVTLQGEIVEIGGDALDAPGLDMLGLICGSEGQFGVVTEATLRILPLAEGARPILFGFPSPEAAGACVAAVLGAGIVPVAIEYMDKLAIDICEDFAKAGYPRDVGAMLIVEVEGSAAEIDEQLARIGAIAETHGATYARQAKTPAEAAAIWKGRKSAFGAMGRVSDYICMDGTIPTGKLPEVLTRIGEICEAQGLKVANIFHAGDGNLHPLVLYDMNDPVSLSKAEKAGEDILLACVEAGGCLTGEHGVGIEKRDLMTAQFTRIELMQQMRVKSVFDPAWLLNPAKVFPLENRIAKAAA